MSEIASIRALLSLWPTRAEAAADMTLALPAQPVTVHRVHKWAENGNVPSKYHQQLLRAAVARGFAVTADLIVALHAPREAAE